MSKKYLISIVMTVLISTAAWSQNANRSGFFLEFGAGSFAVNPPMKRVSVSYKQSSGDVPVTMTREELVEYMGGVKYDFTMGYRIATSAYCAVNLKIDALFDGQSLDEGGLLLTKLMPGVRYTSPELFKNISLYGMLSAGAGIRICGSYEYYDDSVRLAICGSVELGVNFTEKFYLGAFYDIIVMKESVTGLYWYYNSGYDEDGYVASYSDNWCNSGLIGAKLGFRF
ncbi:MAG: hypothetical protein UHE62_06000 [Muribaculaceae bacterium]|nr:hypothetical protein [Muribaculaceae bacterium]